MSAKSEAIKKLGREDDYINAKGYATERTNAQNRYNTDYTNLQNAYNELLATADRNKVKAGTDFNTSRNAVNANTYMVNRGKTGADLSSRGLSQGFGSAGRTGTTLQRNQANSNLANTYYGAMADIQRDIDLGTQEYNYDLDTLKLDLDKQLADIGAREAAARNNYRAQVAQLAEQIQSRWDTENYYKSQLALEKQGLQSKYAEQFVLGDKLDSRHIIDEANRVVSEGGAVLKNGTEVTNTGQALQWLQENGRYRLTDVQSATKLNTNKELAKAYNAENGFLATTKWYVDDKGNLRVKPKWYSPVSGVSQ